MGQTFKSRFRQTSSLGLALSIFALTLAPARADDPSPQDSSKIEKVTVTAQKRVQDSQDVPASVTTLGGKKAQDLGVNTTDKLAEFVPDVSIGMPSGQGNQPIITIRGVGNNDFNTNNAGPNGVYADEVYLSAPSAQTFQTFDLQQIDVLRGPQGTLYGRNTSSGLINYVSNKPDFDDFSAGFAASYGSFDAEEESGFINLPTSDDSAARFAFIRDTSEGFMKNLLTGDHVSGTDSFAARAQWKVDPSENFSLLFNLHGGAVDTLPTEYHQVGTTQGALSFTPCSEADIKAHLCTDTFGYSGPTNIYDGNYNRTQHLNVKNEGGSVHGEYSFGNVTLTSITAFEHNTKLHPEDSDAGPLRLLEIDYGVRSNTFTEELRLAGRSDKFNWILGGYYLNETLKQNQTIDIFLDADLVCGAFCGDNPVPGDTSTAFAQIGKSFSDQKTRSYAVFGQGEYEIFDRTNLTLGGRFTLEDRDFNVTGLWTSQDGGIDNYDPFQQLWAFHESIEDKGFSWRVALDHRFDETVMTYASIATGFKSGGFNGGFLDVNPVNAADQAEPIKPERNLAYEVGVKTDLLDKRLRLNLAGFWYDYKNLQVLNLVNTSTAFELQILDNAPKATIKGIEFEGIAKPFSNFTLTANASWLDAKIDEFASGAVDYSGNTLPLAPKFSMTAIGDYSIPLGGGDFIDLLGSASYKSKVFFDLANNPLVTQDGFWLFDARASYVMNDGEWVFSVYGRNLSDEKYDNFAFDLTQTFGLLEQIVGPPLTVGAEVRFRYN
jgi:iron complex outermembrane receptor protein